MPRLFAQRYNPVADIQQFRRFVQAVRSVRRCLYCSKIRSFSSSRFLQKSFTEIFVSRVKLGFTWREYLSTFTWVLERLKTSTTNRQQKRTFFPSSKTAKSELYRSVINSSGSDTALPILFIKQALLQCNIKLKKYIFFPFPSSSFNEQTRKTCLFTWWSVSSRERGV